MRALLLDIEGTTTELAFVQSVLFPYARARLPAWLMAHARDPEIAAIIDQIRAQVGSRTLSEVVGTLTGWADSDRKVTPLKALQGHLWTEGYTSGQLRAHVYPDVAPALIRWRAAGHRIACYSSGSVRAQQQLFANSIAGDLSPYFDAWFDTETGAKRDPRSYAAIVAALDLPPSEVIFLSDVVEELDAAALSGLATAQVVREGTQASGRHREVGTFEAV